MGAREPQQVNDLFVKFFESHDLDGLMSLYEDEAVSLVVSPTTPVRGKASIREALQGFLSSGASMEFVAHAEPIISGDLALTHGKWRAVLPGADPIEGVSDEVLRRNADGDWLYVIGNPWGSSVIDASS